MNTKELQAFRLKIYIAQLILQIQNMRTLVFLANILSPVVSIQTCTEVMFKSWANIQDMQQQKNQISGIGISLKEG